MIPQLLAPSVSETADPLVSVAAAWPLGRPFGQIPDSDGTPTVGRPFGLRYAVAPTIPIVVDLTGLRYDIDKQVCVDAVGVPVYDKHSTGPTSTQTSDGHQGMDPDTDHTED